MLAGVSADPAPELGQELPQLLFVGQVMNKLIGTLNVAGPPGGKTTTVGTDLAMTIDLAQAPGLIVQMIPPLPMQARPVWGTETVTMQKLAPMARPNLANIVMFL